MDFKNNPLYEKAKKIAEEKGEIDIAQYSDNLEQLLEEHRIFEIELEYQNQELRRVQVLLEEALQEFKNLYNNSPVGYITISQDLKIISVNDSFCEILGFEKETIKKQSFTKFISPDYQDSFYFFTNNLFNKNKSDDKINLFLKPKSDSDLYVLFKARINNEKHSELFCAIIDITAQYKAEKNLNAAALQWSGSFDAINYGIAIVSSDNIIIRANSSLIQLFDADRENIIGSKFFALLHSSEETDNCEVCFAIKNGIKTEKSFFEKSLSAYLEISVDPIAVYDGLDNCSVVVVKDISDRKHLEKNVEQSEKRYKAVFENHHTPMILVDPITGDIIRANPAAETFYGYSLLKLETMNISEINNLSQQQLYAELNNAGQRKVNFFKFKHKLADGSLRNVEVHSGPIFVDGKNLLFSIIHDSTEKERIDADLIETNKQLSIAKKKAENADKLKSAFLANVSHEIRTPLNGIMGFAELLNSDDIDPEQRKKFAGIIMEAGGRLLDILNDILDLSKIEAGQTELKIQEFDIIEMFNNLSLVYIEKQSSVVKFIYKKPENDTLIVNADRTRIYQIVNNLLSNAFKFTSLGEIILSYKVEDKFLEIKVKDSGVGIAQEFQKFVFDRFTQLEDKSGAIRGTGLGLAIVKSLCQLMGGEVKLVSDEGKGSEFTVKIPIETQFKSEAHIENHVDNYENPVNTNVLENLRGKIIVAEDEEINQDFFATVLRRSKIEFYLARNGVEVIELAHKHPDSNLILMDIKMPILNGIEATKRILKSFPKMKIVAHSAYVREEEMNKNFEAGCIDFMSKPFKVNTLVSLLRKYLPQ